MCHFRIDFNMYCCVCYDGVAGKHEGLTALLWCEVPPGPTDIWAVGQADGCQHTGQVTPVLFTSHSLQHETNTAAQVKHALISVYVCVTCSAKAILSANVPPSPQSSIFLFSNINSQVWILQKVRNELFCEIDELKLKAIQTILLFEKGAVWKKINNFGYLLCFTSQWCLTVQFKYLYILHMYILVD